LSYKRQAASETRQVDDAGNGFQLGFSAIPMFPGAFIAVMQLHRNQKISFCFQTEKYLERFLPRHLFVALLHLPAYNGSAFAEL
jgi:hypothetical protein